MHTNELVSILVMATGPVILISGIGLLLLSMTNRFGRAIDRSRQLCHALQAADTSQTASLREQLAVLARRARIIRAAIALAAVAVLMVAVLIITLFLSTLLHWELVLPLIVFFGSALAALIGSLVFFIWDINLSLAALELEIKSSTQKTA
jgi:hypothetical protein